ncbi:MAG: Na+/H+ antiporter NhaC family protein [Planctomycetes bacterium]|nr:Na+/H+ antiporter NhaC family protein [Planctomycetota bacterium]
MKRKILIKTAASTAIFTAICVMAALAETSQTGDTQAAPWYSIIPPLLTIVLAFLTRNVLLSIAAAIITGGLLTTMPSEPAGMSAILAGLKATVFYPIDTLTNIENLKILAFVPPIFAMVEIIIVSGGFNAILQKLLPLIKTQKSAQAATALMGLIYFIDDYSNAVIVGSSMRPVTDRFGISREKLAFIVDATSAPITSLAVISTWIVYEVGLFTVTAQKLGIEKDGYSMFFDSLAFRFYCILMLGFVFGHILFGCDFGPMKKAQNKTQKNPPVNTDITAPTKSTEDKRPASILNALIPIAGLVLFHLSGLWFDGGGPAKITSSSSIFHWQYWRQVIGSSENSILILIYASLLGLSLAVLCATLTQSLQIPDLIKCIISGTKKCLLPCLILISAWSLKNCCDSLNTDRFLTNLLTGNISPLWFPAIVFLVASVTSFATGTSWGTMAIIIPTAVPIAFALDGDTYGLTTIITLGAVLDGAIFGDHCSPISDTTIISSIASRCDHIQHVRTQLPYSIFVAVLALLCGYIPAALGLSPLLSITIAITVMVIVFVALPRLSPKNSLP